MEIAKDIRDFLMTRRAKITPDQVGLPVVGRRRVAGLRREEVARLAGVSTEYYIQVERGRVAGVSDEVLQAIASALLLDEEETTHLFDLARAATEKSGKTRSRARIARQVVPEGVQALMDAMVTAPAIVQNGHMDILAANALGRAIYADVFDRSSGVPNLARFIFLDTRAGETFPAWEKAANDVVGLLRVEAARSPYSTAVTGLIGELATRSDEFRTRWAAHEVRAHRRGTKRFHHRLVGDMTLRFEALALAGDTGLTMFGYTAEPNSPSHEALQLLASWVATEHSPAATDRADTTVSRPDE
ncbi:helix-turn-helix domain-containing protein [Nocardia mexicana]|uniref:Helix-turn-helix protein n=1 Tax=Nocardia mexicana TaxID=279262 RepID=A0A370HFL4_9NOCA|nr:helix-turn-helix transcriptional regulator [Nocardia mexicana]RDI55983.1 helix-turn-helix protein [Nocardia mexicana]